MTEYLKGNFPMSQPPVADGSEQKSLEQEFEASALQKLGGSIAFVKKSTKFVWDGPTNDEPGRATR
jgi:hypothetical protein